MLGCKTKVYWGLRRLSYFILKGLPLHFVWQTKNSWLFSRYNERQVKTGESLFKSAAQLRNWPLTTGLMEYYDSSKKACKNHMEWQTNTFNVPIRNSHSWWCSHSCRLLGRSLKWRREPSLGSFTIIIMLTKTCWWWSNFIERNNISLFDIWQKL